MKKYNHTFISILVIIAWVAVVFKIFYSEKSYDWVIVIPIALLITIVVGVVGGSILIFIRMTRKPNLKFSWIYNLFGTLSILAGFAGLASSTGKTEKPLYLASACFAVGLFIYNDIYFRKIPATKSPKKNM